MHIQRFPLAPGEPTVSWDIISKAYAECIELQVLEEHEWTLHTLGLLEAYPRIEVHARSGKDVLGCLVLVGEEREIHVKRSLTVLTQYVLPEHRNTGVSLALMREAVRIAKENNFPILGYTHRIGDWTYESRYRRIHSGKSNRRAC